MRRSGIYRIELGNGYFYIGSTVNLDRREKRHLDDLKCSVHINKKMQNCWNKYGMFEFTVLEECEMQQLLLQEQLLIDKHFDNPKNVNINKIAGSSLGYKHSVEARAKMSAIKIGRVHSSERRAKNSAAQIGSDANQKRWAKFRMEQLAMEEMEYGKKCS